MVHKIFIKGDTTMSDIRDLLNRAMAQRVTETKSVQEDTLLDDLDGFVQDVAASQMPVSTANMTKDGQQLQVGDPVTGIHRGQNMAGQVIAIQDDKAVVEWKDRETTKVKINTLTLTNVDDDYTEETMYIEAAQPIQTMGFDKEAFVEDADLHDLLKGDPVNGSSSGSFRYGTQLNDF